jgi:formate dehydrogenase major subunit
MPLRHTRFRMLHMLHAKETGCKMIVVDPRFTRTAAKADEYVRIRSGTDIAFLFGVLYHVFKNGWEDKKYLEDRVWAWTRCAMTCWPSGRPTRSRRLHGRR